ncbi:MAG: DNA repair protein [Oscillospiraceae bacterium]|nr:DNA repair protein [Oscillospiraceae bacterium]
MTNYYAVIDLKSFYASVECVVRGLDPFRTDLVVADPSRGRGAICLAITPAMKEKGVRNRCRIYEIPKNINYFTAPPRMKLYMQYSADIYSIYCKFISPEDIYVYSIDECFLDFTPYLGTYRKTPKELAVMIMDEIYERTGICATAGIGTNMFLAKVALDITAKHVPDHIGYLDESEFMCTIQRHRPITDIWNIGSGIAKRLERCGVYDLKGVADMDKKQLFRMFGMNAQFLIDHAVGQEPCTMQDIKSYKSKSRSLSNSQILFEDYGFRDARLVMREMVDGLILEMIEKHLVTDSISLFIGYSKDVIKPVVRTMKIGEYTNSFNILSEHFLSLYNTSVDSSYPVRRIGIALCDLEDEECRSFTFFTDTEEEDKEERRQRAIIEIKSRYGKNAILRGTSFEDKATARLRNTLVGGHRG